MWNNIEELEEALASNYEVIDANYDVVSKAYESVYALGDLAYWFFTEGYLNYKR